MNVTDWSAQNPELNPTDNLWVKLRPRSEPEDHQVWGAWEVCQRKMGWDC